jgi:hypothetical protein
MVWGNRISDGRHDTVDNHAQPPEKWINPLLEKLNLIQPKRAPMDLNRLWAELEDCRIAERIHHVISKVNEQAGYRILQLFDFLPPQRFVLRVVFEKRKTEYTMDMVLGENGAAMVFHSAKLACTRWRRYIYGESRPRGHSSEVTRFFRAAEITDRTIEAWLSFLLSGFDRHFGYGLNPQQSVREISRPNSLFR